jgi:DNA-binding transcriptional LysR family regulator
MIVSAPWRADALAIRQVRAFCLVYQHQSYAAAARELKLSVPTIWEQVRMVEEQYGETLLERQGRRIRPTAMAEFLFGLLQPLLAGFDSTFSVVREQAGEAPRTLTLVTGVRMMLEELGPPLRAFRDRHPQVVLQIAHCDDREAQRRISEETADLGILLEPRAGKVGATLSVERAYEIEYLVVLAPGDPLGQRRSLRLADLVSRPLIVGHPGTHARQMLEEALHREGLRDRMRIAVETDNSAFTMACVRAGMGVGIVAGQENGFLSRGLKVLPLRRSLGKARIVFLLAKGRQSTRVVLDLMECIRSRLQEQ